MGPIDEELALRREKLVLECKNAILLLKSMQEPINFAAELAQLQAQLGENAEQTAKFAHVMDKTDDVGATAMQIGDQVSELTSTADQSGIARGFHFGGVVFAAFDFVRIPLIYLMAFILNEKVPLTLSNNMKWLYSAALLSLTITSMLVPPAAVIISFILAATGLAISVFSLGRIIRERYMLGRELKNINNEINRGEEALLAIQQEAQQLELLLAEATDEDHIASFLAEADDGANLMSLLATTEQIKKLKEDYDSQKKHLSELTLKQQQLNEQKQQVGVFKFADRGLGIAFASLFIIGLVVSLFFPPAGLIMLTTVVATSGTYLLGRLAAPLLVPLFKSSAAPVVNEAESNLEEPPLEKPTHESTTDVLVGLMGREAHFSHLVQGSLSDDDDQDETKITRVVETPPEDTEDEDREAEHPEP